MLDQCDRCSHAFPPGVVEEHGGQDLCGWCYLDCRTDEWLKILGVEDGQIHQAGS